MCNCLQESEKRTLKHLKESLSKQKNIAKFHDESSGYKNSALMFSGPVSNRLFFEFEVLYTPIKKNFEHGRIVTYKANIFFSFCPFCGEKYPEDKDEMKPVVEQDQE